MVEPETFRANHDLAPWPSRPLHADATPPSSTSVPFVTALQERADELHHALCALVSESVGGLAQAGADLRHALSIDGKLACQLFDAYIAPNPVAFSACLPSIRRLFAAAAAAERAGVSVAVIDAYRSAVSRFDAFIAEHAGTRWKFDAIVWCLNDNRNANTHTEVDLRRSAMQATARMFGSTVDTVATIALVGPERSTNDRFDLAWLTAGLGVRRLRPHLKVPIAWRRFTTSDISEREPISVQPPQPIFPEPAGSPPGVHLVPGRCTPESPPLSVVTTRSGHTIFELRGDDIGEASTCDLITASFNKEAVPATRSADDPTNRYTFNCHVRHACERYLLVVGYPLGVVSSLPPVCTFRSDQYPNRTDSEPVLQHTLTPDIVSGEIGLRSLGLPQISGTLSDAFGRLGWDQTRYTFFVIDQQYPLAMSVISASIMIGQSNPDACSS